MFSGLTKYWMTGVLFVSLFTVAMPGTLVWKKDESGDWLKIQGLGRERDGYIHSSLLALYRPMAKADDAE